MSCSPAFFFNSRSQLPAEAPFLDWVLGPGLSTQRLVLHAIKALMPIPHATWLPNLAPLPLRPAGLDQMELMRTGWLAGDSPERFRR